MADRRKEIEFLVQQNKPLQAHIKLREFIDSRPSLDTFIYAEKIYGQIDKELSFHKIKIAVLRSVTIEPILPFVRVKCFESKLSPELYFGDYNVIDQEIMNENSGLYDFDPDVLIIFGRLEEICPRLVDSYIELSSEEVETEIRNVLEKIEFLVSTFRTNSNARAILHNFQLPAFPVFGIVDNQHGQSQKRTFEKINTGLSEIVRKYEEVYLLDYEHLVSLYGKRNWLDERLWFIAKAPVSRLGLEALANEYVKYFRAMLGLTKKCIVLDLDNTLWGGVLGEGGIEGIEIGHTHPGNAFMDFQRELLKLYHRGVILAVNSKNNEEDVMEVFDKHPDMVLRRKHFASIKANWISKVQNMKDIAKDLNIGIDTFVFLDDSPVERELVRQQLPEIHTVELPNSAHFYSKTLNELPDFETLSFSEEDMERGRLYQEQIPRRRLKESAACLEEFYISLEMEATIKKGDSFSIPRLAIMTQKTNQFNLTTIRYSESDISHFVASSSSRVYSLQLTDRFGDSGIVGEVITEENGDAWEINTFLLSCRVIGRTVETAFLSFVVEKGREAGIKSITGKYVPTGKNIVVEDFYEDHGFRLVEDIDGTTIWKLDMEKSSIKRPDWVKVIEE